MRLLALLFQFILVSVYCYAAPSESWLDRPTGSRIVDIEVCEDCIWCSTKGSLFKWDKTGGTYGFYTVDDGLVTGDLSDLLLDDNNMLWIGSSKGLHSFNGESFTVYTTDNSGLVNNSVTALYEDDTGILWCGTEGGVSCFDGTYWTNYTTDNSGLGENRIGAIAGGGGGVVWFTHPSYFDGITGEPTGGNGVSRFDGSSWEHFTSENSDLPSDDIGKMEIAGDGTLWLSVMAGISFENKGYVPVSFDGEKWKRFYTEHIDDMEITSDDTVWISYGSYNGTAGLRSYNGERWTNHDIDTLFPDRVLGYSDIRFDNDGSMWIAGVIAVDSHILYRYDGTSVRRYAVEGPKSYDFNDIAVGPDNTLWFATNAGISMFDRSVFINKSLSLEETGLSSQMIENFGEMANRVRSMEIDRAGTAWIGTMFGIWSYDGENWILYDSFLREFKHFSVWDIVTDQENVIWFLTGDGLLGCDNEQWTEHELPADYSGMKIDRDGVKWFVSSTAGDSHIASYDGENWLRFTEENSPFAGNPVALAVDLDNSKWLGTEKGLWRFDDSGWTDFSEHVAHHREYGGYAFNNNDGIYIDGENIKWFIVDEKLVSFDGTNWIKYDNKHTGPVELVTVDNDNILWIYGYNGGKANLKSFDKGDLTPVLVEKSQKKPALLDITGNYPNPFNPSTTIEYSLAESGFTELAVYNIAGQKIKSLVSSEMTAGRHSVMWDGYDDHGNAVSSGVYLSRLKSGEKVTTQRMLFMK